jgi:hypothetical protein
MSNSLSLGRVKICGGGQGLRKPKAPAVARIFESSLGNMPEPGTGLGDSAEGVAATAFEPPRPVTRQASDLLDPGRACVAMIEELRTSH